MTVDWVPFFAVMGKIFPPRPKDYDAFAEDFGMQRMDGETSDALCDRMARKLTDGESQ